MATVKGLAALECLGAIAAIVWAPDTGFALAAVLVLHAYLGLVPGAAPAAGRPAAKSPAAS